MHSVIHVYSWRGQGQWGDQVYIKILAFSLISGYVFIGSLDGVPIALNILLC